MTQEFRERAKRVKLGLEDEPRSWFLAKAAFTAVFILGITFVLASYRGTPIVLVILAALILIYSTVMNAVRLRPAHLRPRRQPARRPAFRRGHQAGRFLAVRQHGRAGRDRRRGLHRPQQLRSSRAGTGFELDAIAACFIGGAAVTGGIGTVTGAIIGGLIMGVLNNGMSLLGLGSEVQSFIKGFVLLFAVAFDIFNKRRAANASK